LNVAKILIIKKETQVFAKETRGVGTEMALKIHGEKRNSANKLFWQSVLESCRIEFENCRITWKRSTQGKDMKSCYFSEKNRPGTYLLVTPNKCVNQD